MIRFCLALASVAFWPQLPPPVFLLLLLAGIVLARGYPRLRGLLPLLFGWLIGCSYGQWQLAHRLSPALEGQTVAVVGTVVGLPAQQGDFCRFELQVEKWPQSGWFTPRLLRLNWYQCAQLPLPAQRWQLQLRLKRPHGYRNPGTWDRELQLLSAGIDAIGYVYAGDSATQLAPSRWRGRWDRWRWQLAEQQRQLLPSDTAALVNALLLGDRRYLSDAQWQRLRNSGTLHLFVVSGLHIGMVALLLYRLLVLLGRLLPWIRLHRRQWLAVVGALAVALAYAWLAGFALPTQRAWIMVTVLLVGWVSWQQRSAATRLGLAASLVLVLDPLAVRSAGFWLSFCAAAMLLYAFVDGTRYGWWRGLVRAQWAALLGIGPCLLWVFYQLPVLAPLLNLVAIPLVTLLLLPLLLLGLVISFVGLGSSVLQAGGWIMAVFDQALQELEPYLWQWPAQGGGLLALLCAGVGALLLLGPRLLPGRWLGWLMLLPLLWPRQVQLSPGEYAVTVLDVGQGSAVWIETRSHRLLYDTGPGFVSGFSAAQAAVIPHLQSRGITRMDRLLLSHADSDHAGGANVVQRMLRVGDIVSGEAEQTGGETCVAGNSWRWDSVLFEVLSPPAASVGDSGNNRSCVVRIAALGGVTLLMGDAELPVEQRLLASVPQQLQADLLLAGHHGSRSSSSPAFVAAVKPQAVVFSSGYRNRYGHPHSEVVERFVAQGSRTFNTAQQGAQRWLFAAAGMQRQRPWPWGDFGHPFHYWRD